MFYCEYADASLFVCVCADACVRDSVGRDSVDVLDE